MKYECPEMYRNEKKKIDDLNIKIKHLDIDKSVPIFPSFYNSYDTRKSTMNIWDERGMLVQHVKCHRIGGSIGRSQRHVTSSPCDLKNCGRAEELLPH